LVDRAAAVSAWIDDAAEVLQHGSFIAFKGVKWG
jgi:hypothetical protein